MVKGRGGAAPCSSPSPTRRCWLRCPAGDCCLCNPLIWSQQPVHAVCLSICPSIRLSVTGIASYGCWQSSHSGWLQKPLRTSRARPRRVTNICKHGNMFTDMQLVVGAQASRYTTVAWEHRLIGSSGVTSACMQSAMSRVPCHSDMRSALRISCRCES